MVLQKRFKSNEKTVEDENTKSTSSGNIWGCYVSLNLSSDLFKIDDFEFVLEKEIRKKLIEWKLISEN